MFDVFYSIFFIDPRHCSIVKATLEVAVLFKFMSYYGTFQIHELLFQILCGQYLPKTEPRKTIIDPYVTVEIFGIPKDSV